MKKVKFFLGAASIAVSDVLSAIFIHKLLHNENLWTKIIEEGTLHGLTIYSISRNCLEIKCKTKLEDKQLKNDIKQWWKKVREKFGKPFDKIEVEFSENSRKNVLKEQDEIFLQFFQSKREFDEFCYDAMNACENEDISNLNYLKETMKLKYQREFFLSLSSKEELYSEKSAQENNYDNIYYFLRGINPANIKEKLEAFLNKDTAKKILPWIGISVKEFKYAISFEAFKNNTRNDRNESNLIIHEIDWFGKEEKDIIVGYLLSGERRSMLLSYENLTDTQILNFNKVLQVYSTKQQEAKKMGHLIEAELFRQIKKFLEGTDYEVLPEQKGENPMCRDIRLDEELKITKDKNKAKFSADLVVIRKKTKKIPEIVIQSLIHTSDPGQFGVSKMKESIAISEKLKEKKIPSWIIMDGIGYAQNKSGILIPAIEHFDCFLQKKTFFKAILEINNLFKLNKIASVKIDEEMKDIFGQYVKNAREQNEESNYLELGIAKIYLK